METIHNRIYSGIIIGMSIRGSIANTRIFRVRRGNGHRGSIQGLRYQDQYAYFVPLSINNPQGQGARDALTAGVTNWQGFTPAQKRAYYIKAQRKHLKMAGYHLYMREYIKANA